MHPSSPLSTPLVGRCPRCGGTLVAERDHDGRPQRWWRRCAACRQRWWDGAARREQWCVSTGRDEVRTEERAVAYQVGDFVEVNASARRQALGARGGLVTEADPCGPPEWTAAVVEGVRAVPGSAGFERYTVCIRDGRLAGATGDVGASSIRPPSHE